MENQLIEIILSLNIVINKLTLLRNELEKVIKTSTPSTLNFEDYD